MYKNFNISESEKEQILNRLRENGYGQPINEQKTPPFNGKGGTPPLPSKPTGPLPSKPTGSKYKIDPKLSVPVNIKNAEQTIGRPLTPPEVHRLINDLKNMGSHTSKHTSTPSVDKNDVTGDNKGEGVNLYGDQAQTVLQYSATIDRIVKSGTGFDIFVSGDYDLNDKYFHWEPKSPYFQAFVKSTRKPLTWEYKGKMRNQTLYNKQFSSVLQNMVVPTPSSTNNDVDFVSGNVNEQTDPSKYGTAVDSMNIIKEKIIGKPVRFFSDRELQTPAYDGANFTFSKVEKDGSDSTKFNIYFKEFNDPLTFRCGTFKDALYRPSKREFLYNATLYKYLTTALCNTELNNNGKLKSVPNVKYAKNDTQGLSNQTGTENLSEEREFSLEELSNHYVVYSQDVSGLFYLLRQKEGGKFGLYNSSAKKWQPGYEPTFVSEDLKLYQTDSDGHILMEKYVSDNGKSFYKMYNVESMKEKFLNEKDHDDIVQNLKYINTDEPTDNGGFDEKYSDKVYEETPLNEGKQILKDVFKSLIK